MHKTMKGNIVLLASTQALIKVPRNSDLTRCLEITSALCDILPDDDSSDVDWSESTCSRRSSMRSHSASGDETNYGSPSVSQIFRRKLPTRSTTDGSSPLINGETLEAGCYYLSASNVFKIHCKCCGSSKGVG